MGVEAPGELGRINQSHWPFAGRRGLSWMKTPRPQEFAKECSRDFAAFSAIFWRCAPFRHSAFEAVVLFGTTANDSRSGADEREEIRGEVETIAAERESVSSVARIFLLRRLSRSRSAPVNGSSNPLNDLRTDSGDDPTSRWRAIRTCKTHPQVE